MTTRPRARGAVRHQGATPRPTGGARGFRVRPRFDRKAVKMMKTFVSILAIACVTLGLGGCGGGSESSSDEASADAVAQVEAVCAELRDELDARGDFPVNDFDPESPSPEALPVVGDYFASAITATEKALASLRDLDAPAGMKVQLDSFTAAMAAQLANAKKQIAAAKRSDVAGFTATLATASETIETFDQAAGALGAESCRS